MANKIIPFGEHRRRTAGEQSTLALLVAIREQGFIISDVMMDITGRAALVLAPATATLAPSETIKDETGREWDAKEYLAAALMCVMPENGNPVVTIEHFDPEEGAFDG